MKMMSPNTRIDWIPVNGIADPENPTLAELNAGTNISAAIVTGYTLAFTDSDTDDSKTIVDESNVQTRTFANYEGDLTFFRSDLTNVTAVYNTARALFKDGRVEGYLAVRHGKKATAAYAAGDVYSLFHFISGDERTVESDGGGPIQVSYPFHPQGFALSNVEAPAA